MNAARAVIPIIPEIGGSGAPPDLRTVFVGESEMAIRCRALDWGTTPFGDPAQWSPRMRAALQCTVSAPVASLLMWGPELAMVYNDHYRMIAGSKHPAALAQPASDVWSETWPQNIPVLERVLAGESLVISDVRRVVVRQGEGGPLEEAYFTVSYTPVYEDDGSISAILVHAFEKTREMEQRRAEEETRRTLETARDSLAEANREQGAFLAMMSHELRTPLNAIGGYVDLMELGIHGAVTPGQVDALQRIRRSQRHLLGLINGVLNYAKVESGAVTYTLDAVDLDDVIITAETLVAPQVQVRGLSLRYADDSSELFAWADRERVEQIALNLLSNAVKFTEAGGVITIGCMARGAAQIVLRVSDTGRGIAAADLERVFEPFVQVERRRILGEEGTGLGLSISRDLARAMGGDLTVTSALGEGSTFSLVLPRHCPPTPGPVVPPSSEHERNDL